MEPDACSSDEKGQCAPEAGFCEAERGRAVVSDDLGRGEEHDHGQRDHDQPEVRNWRLMYAIAPSWMASAMWCISASPESAASTAFIKTKPTASATKATARDPKSSSCPVPPRSNAWKPPSAASNRACPSLGWRTGGSAIRQQSDLISTAENRILRYYERAG